jgi:hypothetical protein
MKKLFNKLWLIQNTKPPASWIGYFNILLPGIFIGILLAMSMSFFIFGFEPIAWAGLAFTLMVLTLIIISDYKGGSFKVLAQNELRKWEEKKKKLEKKP